MSQENITIKIFPKKKIYTKKLNKNGEKKENIKISTEPIIMESTDLKPSFLELMDNLAYIMRKKKDFMRAKAYVNAKESIQKFNATITTPDQLKGLPGIGVTIFEKLKDYQSKKTLRVLDENKDLVKQKKAIDVFLNIYGIGEKKAEDLVSKNILSLDDLEKVKETHLNDKQLIGLKYYNDILQRIPRNEIEIYEKIFKDAFNETGSEGHMEIVGSYRRGAATSGDIDVILTSQNKDFFTKFVDLLLNKNIIIEVLSRGPCKCLVITKLPNALYARRVDFLFTTQEEYPFAILYFTGSKEFNTSVRERSLKLGFTLNEHGFSKMEGKKKGDKLIQEFKSEKDIFDFLKIKYREPSQRNSDKLEEIIEISQPKSENSPKRTTRKKRDSNKKTKILEKIEDFKKNGIKIVENSTEKELTQMIDAANDAFHTKGKPLMTDNEYDILHDYMKTKYPKSEILENVGANVVKNKVKLPYEMWSMDKIKPDTNVLLNWKQKYTGPYVISCKLDGVSGLYTTEGEKAKLYTRGDGKIGQDISHMIPYLQLPTAPNLVIRGEFIISKRLFDEKYKTKFANPRNLVAGIVNQKTKLTKENVEKYRDLNFVAYELIKHPDYGNNAILPVDQMRLLENMNIQPVKFNIIESQLLTNEFLSNVLQDWRLNYDYEIDGIIVCNNGIYERLSGNPKHAFAFKMVLSDQIAEAHVVDVKWSPSKDGYLKPRVEINPIQLGGVTITYATGFNAAFIETNKIGIGAIIMLVRSGDVIPYIKSVTSPASEAKMPDVDYIWNESHVDIMLKDKSSDSVVLEKNITGFFKGLSVDGLGSGNVVKIMKAGYDSIPKILDMKEEDFLKVEGFKKKMAEKVYNSIREKVENASIIEIAAHSNVFSRGFSEKKIELILNDYPNILNDSKVDVERLQKIKGIEKKTADSFVAHIDDFKKFLKECKLEHKLVVKVKSPKKIDTSHPLYGKTIVISGFRDKDLENKLKEVGVKIGSGVNKKTDILLVKNKEEKSGKILDAEKLNIKIENIDDFKY